MNVTIAPSNPYSDCRKESLMDRLRQSQGFTMVEIMVVVAIVALIFFLALPTLTSQFQVSLNSTARDISNVIREAYNASVMTGNTYRLAFDLDEGTYWVESGPSGVLLDTEESLEKRKERERFLGDDKKKERKTFKMDESITPKKLSLPIGVSFEDVMNQASEEEPITKGIAYCHFFPHGLTEQTIVHVKDSAKHHVSLVVTSLVGEMDIYNRYVDLKEAFPE